jgi:N-methylhydantoinase A
MFEVARTYRFKKGSGLPVIVPVIDLVEIGAGGGSIARLDSIGRVAVGPDSAGSEPGPACYGRGGRDPTVTDCDLVLGKLDAASFAGGTMPLDDRAAAEALDRGVAGPAGLSRENAAYAVTEIISETMGSAARAHAAEIGVDIEARTCVAFGGAAPLHAARFAEKLAISRIVVPSGAGVGSAIGFLRAPIAYEIARTLRRIVDGAPWEPVARALAAMEAEARAIVAEAAGPGARIEVSRTARLRYAGQGHEIEVAVGGDLATPDFAAGLLDEYARTYARLYGQAMSGAPVEATTWIVRAMEPTGRSGGAGAPAMPHAAEPCGRRRIYDGAAGAWQDWAVFERKALRPGATGQGPCVITEDETTTIVPARFSFRIGSEGYIWLDRTGAGS